MVGSFRKMGWMLAATAALAVPVVDIHAELVATAVEAGPAASEATASEAEDVRHVLSRLTFGPRPGEVERVMEIGWQEWVREQLQPGRINDDAVHAEIVRRWPSLTLSLSDAFSTYRPPYEQDPPTREDVRRRNRLRGQIRRELVESVIHRATHSERQLQEVMVEFWRNHFNIDQNKDDTAYLANHYEQQVLRRFAFGKFEHLLLATATHPAMLVYLDNIVSQKPLTDREQALVTRYENRRYVPRSVDALARHRGLNENYARELMELHTLGVDNQYTQRDVTELARALTGWTAGWSDGRDSVRRELGLEAEGYGFIFRSDVHDDNSKRILGTRFNGRGGVGEGVTILRGLARDPRTARFISYKLCRHLVADEPEDELVERIAKVFRDTGGDLPKVYEAIIFSDAFMDPANRNTKFKTPFEFVISSLRATDATVNNYGGLIEALRLMGQPIYGCEDPDGYDDRAEAWLDPGVLVYRWTYALDLAGGRMRGVSLPEGAMRELSLLPGEQLAERLMTQLVPGQRPGHHDQVLRDGVIQSPHPSHALGLVLGSPAFQQQ